MKCPRCGSPHVTKRRAGEIAGGHFGALLGAAFGAASAIRAARAGAVLGAPLGPAGLVAGAMTGAVLRGMFTGSAVSALTSAFGRVLDREHLADRECQSCGEQFRTSGADFDTCPAPEPTRTAEPQVARPLADGQESTVAAQEAS